MSDPNPPEHGKPSINMASYLMRADVMGRIEEARRCNLFRADLANWELAELFHHCMPLAIIDAQYATDFPAFEQQWLPLVGDKAAGWLPSLYLAAVSSPKFSPENRLTLALTALPYLSEQG